MRRSRTGRHARSGKRIVPLVLPFALTVAMATVVAAAWLAVTAPGGAAASGSLTMPAGNQPMATVNPPDGTTVSLSWTASTGAIPVAGYEVRVYDADNGTERVVGASCDGLVTATNCTETDVPAGSWSYTVTPRLQAWAGAESPPSEPVVVNPSYRALIVSNSPGGYWRLGESSGTTAIDEMGNSNGTYAGGFTLGVGGALAGDPNTAVELDGSSGRISVPSVPALDLTSQVTVEAWVNPDTLQGTRWIVNKGTFYYLYILNGQTIFGVYAQGVYQYVTTTAVTTGKWQHLVGTYDGSGLVLYRNGVAVAQAPATGAIASTTTPVFIGSIDNSGAFFDGRLDEVAIYGTALTAEQARAHFQRGNLTRPDPDITFPVANGSYNNTTWNAGCSTAGVGDLCGTAADTGGGVASVQVSIRQGSGNYWNGTSFASVSEVLLPATGTNTWTLGFDPASFPADGTYTVRAVATDNAGNSASISTTFTIDRTVPTVAYTFPAADGSYNNTTWNAGCSTSSVGDLCGTAADTGGGVGSVEVSIRQGSSNYWNGTSFASTSEVWIPATGTTTWNLGFAATNFPADGTYNLRTRSIDRAGNTSAIQARSFTIDRTVPTVAYTFPAADGSYNNTTWNAGCSTPSVGDLCGTAADTGSGVGSVWVSIRQGTGNYWNGTSFASTSEVWIAAAGTTTWNLGFAATNFPADGTYTVRAASIDRAGNTSAIQARSFTIDRTAPTAAFTFPAADGSYNDTTWNAGCSTSSVGDLCGTAADTGGGVASVQVSIRQGTGNYWNGTSFASASEVLLSATGTNTWTLGFDPANFPGDGSYTVRAVATDNSGNSAAVSTTFTIDRTTPTVAYTFPTADDSHGTASWTAGCSTANVGDLCGTAADTGGEVASVEVSIRQGAGNYWNGTSFASTSEVWIPATGTTTWNLAFAATNFPADDTYNLRTRSVDRAGNTSAIQTRAFTITRFAPSALTLFNSDGIVTQTIDEVHITFSEAPNLSSICSTWSGTGDQSLGGFDVVVTITDNGSNDTLSVTSTACTLNIGTIQTGRDYVNTTSTFRGDAPFDSRVTWTASSRLLTIHLGAIVAGSLNSSPQTEGTVVYTPHSAITDVVGTPIVTTPFSSSGQRF